MSDTSTGRIKRRFVASFLCLFMTVGLFSFGSVNFVAQAETKKNQTSMKNSGKRTRGKGNSMTKGSFAAPDFAFPKTVIENAEPRFRTAMKEKDPVCALQAAIQMNVAGSRIQVDSYREALNRYDSIANQFGLPWSNIAEVLKARLYSDIYSSQPGIFNRRSIPLSNYPEDVMEWSGPMFKAEISSLVSKVLSDSEQLAAVPLAAIRPLLRNSDEAVKNGFTVFDFLTSQAVELLSYNGWGRPEEPVLPLNVDSGHSQDKINGNPSIESYLKEAVKVSASENNLFKESYWSYQLCNVINDNEIRKEYLRECINRFTSTRYCADFIVDYCELLPNDNESRRNKLHILDDYKSRFPQALNIARVVNMSNELIRHSVNVSFASQLLPGTPASLTVEGANLYNFYVLLVGLPDMGDMHSYRYSDLKNGRLLKAVPIRVPGAVPDLFSDTVSITTDYKGILAIVPSRKPDISGILETDPKVYLGVTNVSGISALTMEGESGRKWFYVVSGFDQCPVAGAKVTLYHLIDGVKRDSRVYTTDSKGRFEFPEGRYEYEISAHGNILRGSTYGGRYRSNSGKRLKASVLTDLSLYRPGQDIKFSNIAYSVDEKELKPATSMRLKILLCDANRKEIDTVNVVTDRFGRADGILRIHEEGLLGNWELRVMDDEESLGAAYIEVAEYKAPTFLVKIESDGDSNPQKDKVIFRGEALTYTGLPVISAKVAYTVRWSPGWWRSNAADATYGDTVVTGPDGKFEIVLDTSGLKNTHFDKGLFTLSGYATDGAGETQEFPSVRFTLGSDFRINAALPSTFEVTDKNPEFDIYVSDMTGRRIQRKVWYRIKKDERVYQEGEFVSPKFIPDFKNLPSARYAVSFSLNPDFKDTDEEKIVTDSIVLWHRTDVRPPVSTSLWVPGKKIVAPVGCESVDVTVGSSLPEGYILAIVSDSKKVISIDWIEVSDAEIKYSVPAPKKDDQIFINFIAESNLVTKHETVTVIPFEQTEKLEIKSVSFRDRIEPGTNEKWKFSLNFNGKAFADGPVMAVMTDKALNVLAPFSWAFDPFGQLYWSPASSFRTAYIGTQSNNYYASLRYISTSGAFMVPQLNTYGYPLYYSMSGYGKIKMTGSRSVGVTAIQEFSTDGVVVKDELKCEEDNVYYASAKNRALSAGSADLAESEVVTDSDAEENGGLMEEPVLRSSECPVAFFMPGLITDNKGNLEIEFTAPEFIGTWQFQLLAYTPDMRGTVKTLDVLSSKSVMAKMNPPRFVRTGDIVSVSSNLFNNTESPIPVAGKFEVLDAMTGDIIFTENFESSIVEALQSRSVSAVFKVPDSVEALTLRIYAYGNDHSDGEQTSIPVLPATSVQRESKTFYLGPSVSSAVVQLPEYSPESSVTLSFCGNPVWDCLTALPGMMTSKSKSVISLSDALFGNAVAWGLLNKYPKLMEGLKIMGAPENASDSILFSPLKKNQELKEFLLNNTPWINVAETESLRMQALLQYVHSSQANDEINAIVNKLSELQNSDGGWSWCPGMESSSFMTSKVLSTFGALKNLGYLPAQAEDLTPAAFRYMDNYYTDRWIKEKRKNYPSVGLIRYLYGRTAFNNLTSGKDFTALFNTVIADIPRNWRDLSIFDKATAAILLARSGKMDTARLIMESIGQYGISTPEKGMWFDTLNESWDSQGSLMTTARVLEAYSMIEPQNLSVDALRQWLVLSKQTQDWNATVGATEAINALLSTGTDWSVPSINPVIKLNGKPLKLPETAILTGAFTLPIQADLASGSVLSVERVDGVPAWGGVVARYILPIGEAKAVKMPELSVSKNTYVINQDGSADIPEDGKFHVGDRVRVTLSINCDRTLDYLAVSDHRAACLEPVEQISQYTCSDGVWYYQEVRDAITNLFISTLSKGTHVISYDCFVTREGEYSLGIAVAQSQYAPLIVASSAGSEIKVSKSMD